MFIVMKEHVSQCRLTDVFLTASGQQWSSMVQMNKIHQGLASETIFVNRIMKFLFFIFVMGFVKHKNDKNSNRLTL